MPKRFLLALTLTLLPVVVLADTSPQTAPADPAALGPQATSGSGGSNADAGALQPAGTAPLQSATDSSAGLTAPTGSVLQAPAATGDALKVLAGEADGAPHQSTEGDDTAHPWVWVGAVIVLAVLSALMVARDRRRFRKPH